MQADEREYSIEDLAAGVDLPVRTIRFYIGRGLLAGPGARGKAASYGEGHLVRLRLIRLLSERRVPLDEIGRWMAGLDTAAVQELLAGERGRQEELQQAAAPSPKDYVAALLRRSAPRPESAAPPYSFPGAPSQPPAGAPRRPGAPPQPPIGPPPRPRPPTGVPPQPPAAPPLGEAQPGDAWQRWEIAPGLQLHARADAAYRYRALIARLLHLGREES